MARRCLVVVAVSAGLVLAAGPLPDVTPWPDCLLGCETVSLIKTPDE
jgi:hypothetical protein